MPQAQATKERLRSLVEEYKHIGRRKRFETPQDLERALLSYLRDVEAGKRDLTVTHLCSALGLTREGLQTYKHGKYGEGYSDIVARARDIITNQYEKLLMDRDTCRGAQFVLERMLGLIETKNVNVDGPPPIQLMLDLSDTPAKRIDSREVQPKQLQQPAIQLPINEIGNKRKHTRSTKKRNKRPKNADSGRA